MQGYPIYDKSDYENISENLLKEIVEEIQNEITEAQQDSDFEEDMGLKDDEKKDEV